MPGARSLTCASPSGSLWPNSPQMGKLGTSAWRWGLAIESCGAEMDRWASDCGAAWRATGKTPHCGPPVVSASSCINCSHTASQDTTHPFRCGFHTHFWQALRRTCIPSQCSCLSLCTRGCVCVCRNHVQPCDSQAPQNRSHSHLASRARGGSLFVLAHQCGSSSENHSVSRANELSCDRAFIHASLLAEAQVYSSHSGTCFFVLRSALCRASFVLRRGCSVEYLQVPTPHTWVVRSQHSSRQPCSSLAKSCCYRVHSLGSSKVSAASA